MLRLSSLGNDNRDPSLSSMTCLRQGLCTRSAGSVDVGASPLSALPAKKVTSVTGSCCSMENADTLVLMQKWPATVSEHERAEQALYPWLYQSRVELVPF